MSAPPPRLRLRACEHAADVRLRAGREPGSGGLERRLAALERVRLGGHETLLQGWAAGRVRRRASRCGGLLRRGTGHRGGEEHRLRRRAAGIAGIAASLDAGDVPVDAAARRRHVGGLAARQVRLEGRLRIALACLDAAHGSAGQTRIRALAERRAAVLERVPEVPEDAPATLEARNLRPADADISAVRAGREPGPTAVLRGRLLGLARDQSRAHPGAVAAVLELEAARLDALPILLETRAEFIRERPLRAGDAI